MAAKGLLNATMSGTLQQIEDKLIETVPAKSREQYRKAVIAGMKVLFDKSTFYQMLGKLNAPGKYDIAAATLAISIVVLLYQRSKMKLDKMILIPLGQVMVLHILDYLDKSGTEKLSNELIENSIKRYVTSMMSVVGITPGKMQAMVAYANKQKQNPQFIAKMRELKK